MPHARGFRPCRDVLVGVAGDEDDGSGDVTVPQPAGQFDAVHIGHLVVDHKTVDGAGAGRVQQRRSVAEGPNVETVGFKEESQRAKHIRVVVMA